MLVPIFLPCLTRIQWTVELMLVNVKMDFVPWLIRQRGWEYNSTDKMMPAELVDVNINMTSEDDDPLTFIAFPRIFCPHWPQTISSPGLAIASQKIISGNFWKIYSYNYMIESIMLCVAGQGYVLKFWYSNTLAKGYGFLSVLSLTPQIWLK